MRAFRANLCGEQGRERLEDNKEKWKGAFIHRSMQDAFKPKPFMPRKLTLKCMSQAETLKMILTEPSKGYIDARGLLN
jgi:hypothetical protein